MDRKNVAYCWRWSCMLYYCLLVMTESPTNTAELKCHLWCGLAAAQVLDGGPDPLMGRGTSEGDMLERAQTCQTVDILKVIHEGTACSDVTCLPLLLWQPVKSAEN